MRIKPEVEVPDGPFCKGRADKPQRCRMLAYKAKWNACTCRLHPEIGFLRGGEMPRKCPACLNAEKVEG